VNGIDRSDTLALNDQGGSTAGTSYQITSGYVRRSSVVEGVQVNYSSIGALTLSAGSGNNDDLAVLDTPASMVVVVSAGPGNDTVHAGSSIVGLLGSIQGPLTVNGQGNTSLTLYDQSTSTSQDYTVTGTAVTRTGGFAVSYANLQDLTLQSASGTGTTDTFAVDDTAAGVSTAIYGHGGYNEFVVYADGGAGINGPVVLHGNPNTASTISFAIYYDYTSPGGQTYTLTANSVSRAGAAPVTYDHLGEMILFASQFGGNTVNVESNAEGNYANLAVAAGDQVNIGSTAPVLGGSLSTILGTVGVSGSAVSVTVDDSGNTSTTSRDVTFRQDAYGTNMLGLTDDPEGDIVYSLDAASSVTVLGDAGNTTYHMQDFLAAVPLTLNAGGGTNTLDYSAATGNVYVNLQTGVATDLAGFSNIQNVIGASGGPAGSYNILVGNGGNVLTGGTGRSNLLIAGSSASTLNGGDTSDLLIAGTTSYDTNAASLQAIAAYWAGSDNFATRVANLESGTGVPLLDATQVTGNGGGNTVNCNGATDLLFANAALDTLNCDPWDTLVLV
jgi:hypothetical protein